MHLKCRSPGDSCSTAGITLLETGGSRSEVDAMVAKLEALEGIDLKTLVSTHHE